MQLEKEWQLVPKYDIPNRKKTMKQKKSKETKSKQEESKGKQENHAAQDKNQEIVCTSLAEAEHRVLELRNQGVPYNKLTGIPFKIGDRIKRFNPKQISAISKTTGTIQESNKSDMPKNDNKIQTIFSLLKNGKSRTEIVIQTGIEPEVVNKAFEQYLEFENYIKCSKRDYQKMRSLVLEYYMRLKHNPVPLEITFKEISRVFDELYEIFDTYMKEPELVFRCSKCKKLTNFDQDDFDAAVAYLSQNHVCHRCTEH